MGRKSAKIAARKGASDQAKAQAYTRTLKDVFKASKGGTADPETNFLLRVAIERCKKFNVPRDNIERAIKKGQGTDGAAGYEDIAYEAYGPNGVALFIETSTNNPTRTAGALRSYFNKYGGSLATTGALQFIFERKAVFQIPAKDLNQDDFTLSMIDAGADDIELEEDMFEVKGPMEAFGMIQSKLQELGITPDEAGLVRVPMVTKEADEKTLEQVDKLIAVLEADDDVVTVYDNLA